ncbi:transcriptional regulator, TetR family [Pedobacter westerhofensis]|uniref:Transcriptional regulator, TetR family n=1 Tax=Pedobacter westerhofensis TaxID=425512 RepID=A0A521FLW7_9SPHI|nr:TetR/AcrR family transcriptional regulator [Pedobacter westerhofensis]SMO96461.1 transcriptional regulator, TetR family [Pedobacter westerhofensis]
MSSKQRRERLKAEVHKSILVAAMSIIKNEGAEALSIRKIADIIEYSPTIIYAYFLNKEAVLIELARQGYTMLIEITQNRLALVSDPKERLEVMLSAYIQFALNENELYQLMYTTGSSVPNVEKSFPALASFMNLYREQMQLITGGTLLEDTFYSNYLVCVSFIHGLALINRYYKDIDPEMNNIVFKKAVKGIISTIEFS